MRRTIAQIFTAITLLFLAHSALANPPLPPALARLQTEGYKILPLPMRAGLSGWIAQPPGDGTPQFYYATPNQDALVMGMLLSPDGQNLSTQQLFEVMLNDPATQQQIIAAGKQSGIADPLAQVSALAQRVFAQDSIQIAASPAPAQTASNLSPGEKLLAAIKNAPAITEGALGAPDLYIFVDMRCPHCKEMYTALRPYADRVRLHLVPVAVLGDESEIIGANILGAANPVAAWQDWYQTQNPAFATSPASPAGTSQILSNSRLMQAWKLSGTPISVYRAHSGQVKYILGQPSNMAELIADITGQP